MEQGTPLTTEKLTEKLSEIYTAKANMNLAAAFVGALNSIALFATNAGSNNMIALSIAATGCFAMRFASNYQLSNILRKPDQKPSIPTP